MAKLKDILNADEKSVKAAELEIAVKKASLQVDVDMLEAETRKTNAQEAYNKALSKLPFSPTAVINAKRDLADAEQDLVDLGALKTELF